MAHGSLGEGEFRRLRDLIHRRFGIDLGPDKKELVVTRLQSVLKRRGLVDFAAYLEFLEQSSGTEAISELIDRISTNHTYFQREAAHFDFLRDDVLPDIVGRPRAPDEKDLRVWCAASSSGEEPYTLMMILLDALGSEYDRWKAGLLATDLSSDALRKAKAGIFSAENVDRLPRHLRDAHFERLPDGRYRVVARVRNEVVFRRLNLIRDRYPFKRPFHVIFCRNVMIYFDAKTRREVCDRLFDVTTEGGWLFVGHSEALDRATCRFRFVRPGVYRRGSGWGPKWS
ncbi:MAG: protein-glutamate O-methyltransferase CheR [Myxococcota bacterium]